MSQRGLHSRKVFDASSMAATCKTAGIRVDQLDTVSFHVQTTNSDGVGTWRIQESNITDGLETKGPSTTDADWVEVTLGITNPPDSAGASQSFVFKYGGFECTFIRLVWTRAAGSAVSTINCWFSAKGY